MRMMKLIKLEKTNTAAMKKNSEIRNEKISVYFPEDIVSQILLRLPARSLGKFRCVCKSWLSITSNTAFVRSNTQRNRITRHSIITEDLTQPTNICSDFGDNANSESAIGLGEYQQQTKSIPEHSLAIASCDGLVCFTRRSTNLVVLYYVVNPLTGQSIALPIDDHDNDHLNFNLGFYFHRSTSKYRLIRITRINSMCGTEVLVIGESSWRRIPDKLPAFFHRPNPVDLNGNIYWLAVSLRASPSEDTVLIFDQEQEVYSVISLPPSLGKLRDFGRKLIDFNGELGLLVAST